VPYLPYDPLNEAAFPEGYGKDVVLQNRLIREKWHRMYPPQSYYMLKRQRTRITDLDTISSISGVTLMDPLHGEAVDPGMAGQEFTQPHLGGFKATTDDTDVFESAIIVPMQTKREAKKEELFRWGFERVRDLLVIIPLVILDEEHVTCGAGDKLTWSGNEYNVKQYATDGYWKATNLRLYMVLNCETRRRGS
jgi:hypothetical protein